MTGIDRLHAFLSAASVSPEVFALRPDYRAVLIAISGITPGCSNEDSEMLLRDAESAARTELAKQPVNEMAHIAAWREAYKAFGTKPNKYRNSLEALTRRVEAGLPRVNRLTDIYNAISVRYQIPLGGEDLDKYSGPPRCIRATGAEDFEVKEKGEVVVEHPEKGEVVWVDDSGVTCRRWNWRQGPRTALSDQTSSVLFIVDALEPLSSERLKEATEKLIAEMKKLGPDVQVAQRVIGAPQE